MLKELRFDVMRANKEIVRLGLVGREEASLTLGNVSGIDKSRSCVAIKPSGVPYPSLTPQDVVVVNIQGYPLEGARKPSVDTPIHLEIYRNFKDVCAIVHAHANYSSSFAQAGVPIDCLGTTHADYFYGPIPVVPVLKKELVEKDYEANLGKAIVETFKKNNINPLEVPACLLQHHGLFAWGRTLSEALRNAVALEKVAEMNFITLGLNSKIKPIPSYLHDKHYLRKHGGKAYYGQ
ncbi:L-ribulose-5-phosphate 4-epimerase AraD [Candidatus Pacearchaeota archaeon]|nr:L-ribulose-5-phosphate 4-epimerase AraD [Candidatus Pacearchaeota archaeon]